MNTLGIKAIAITPDDNVSITEIPKSNELKTLQTAVGGWIGAAYGWTQNPEEHDADVTFFIHDEGKLIGLPMNVQATALWWTLNRTMVGVDHLHGVVVVTGGADENGDTLPVPDSVVELVERATKR